MELSKFIKLLELEFPPETAWSEDKIGLQYRSNKSQIKNIYLTLEVNEATINEAIEKQTDVIITFHPLIFKPLSEINSEERIGSLLTQLIKNDIHLYAIHTNFDSHPEGTSYELCRRLGLEVSNYLEPNENIANRGMGIIAELNESIKLEELLANLTQVCNSPIKYSQPPSLEINKLAILGGSGSSYINVAVEKNCDAIITADVKYHDFHNASGKISVIDPGHYEMEQFVPVAMQKILKRVLGEGVQITLSTVLTNPINYYPDSNYKQKQINYLNN
jgi:dinuclear metal center YbgI/SA1388 family protein